eukprot:8786726-Karenia_brevis.AAC.1
MARMVVLNNVSGAERLISCSSTAAAHIGVHKGVVFVHDAMAFERETCRLRRSVLEAQIQESAEQVDACFMGNSQDAENVKKDFAGSYKA